MTPIEVERLEELLDPPPAGGLTWYRVTLRQGWKRQLRRMFGAIEAPIDRLVRVRIGPVRIDGLHSGKIRRLKAPEVRGLGGGGGRSRGDDRPGADDAEGGEVETRPAARPGARGAGPARGARPSTDRTRSAAAAVRKPGAPRSGAQKPGAPNPGAPKPGAPKPAASRRTAPKPASDRPKRDPRRPDAG
jgi:hypothetical protein